MSEKANNQTQDIKKYLDADGVCKLVETIRKNMLIQGIPVHSRPDSKGDLIIPLLNYTNSDSSSTFAPLSLSDLTYNTSKKQLNTNSINIGNHIISPEEARAVSLRSSWVRPSPEGNSKRYIASVIAADSSTISPLYSNRNIYIQDNQLYINDVCVNAGANIEAVDAIDTVEDYIITPSKPVIEHAGDYNEDTIVLSPNKYYKKTNTSLIINILLEEAENDKLTNEYFIEFNTHDMSTSPTIALPNNIKWLNGEIPTFEIGYTYQLSIINHLGVCAKFA